MDPYKILGVSKNATLEEIQRAYRAKALKHHPDHGGDDWAFQQVREAYAQLLRMHELNSQTQSNQAPPAPASPPPAPSSGTASAATEQQQPSPAEQSPWWHFAFRQSPLQTETSLFIFVNVLDIFVTYLLIRSGGIEANPVARFFIDRWNIAGVVFFKMTMVAFVAVLAQVIALRTLKTARRLLQFGTVIVGAVVVYSLWLYFRHFGN